MYSLIQFICQKCILLIFRGFIDFVQVQFSIKWKKGIILGAAFLGVLNSFGINRFFKIF